MYYKYLTYDLNLPPVVNLVTLYNLHLKVGSKALEPSEVTGYHTVLKDGVSDALVTLEAGSDSVELAVTIPNLNRLLSDLIPLVPVDVWLTDWSIETSGVLVDALQAASLKQGWDLSSQIDVVEVVLTGNAVLIRHESDFYPDAITIELPTCPVLPNPTYTAELTANTLTVDEHY